MLQCEVVHLRVGVLFPDESVSFGDFLVVLFSQAADLLGIRLKDVGGPICLMHTGEDEVLSGLIQGKQALVALAAADGVVPVVVVLFALDRDSHQPLPNVCDLDIKVFLGLAAELLILLTHRIKLIDYAVILQFKC